jgi:hypothetical protein
MILYVNEYLITMMSVLTSIYKEHVVTMVTIHEEMRPLGNKYIYTLYFILYYTYNINILYIYTLLYIFIFYIINILLH